MSKHTVLFELGCEELPPKSLKTLRDALKAEVEKGLTSAGLNFSGIDAYAAPRRLALKITDLDAAQPDSQKRFDGPAVQAAYDSEGKPTKALEGFLRGQGISADQVSRFNAGKMEKVCFYKDIKGQSLDALLPNILQTALDNLPIAKRMRSAASRTEFVRPVQWVVLLKDDQIIDATLQDFKAGNQTFGHRFHAPQAITLKHANDYLECLRAAYVVADFDERQATISAQVKTLADEVNAQPIVPPALLDEVTALVEWPVALRASFEQRFLAVPQEALISTMQDNQKYFCLVDAAGKLQPYFITVSNIDSKDPSQIIEGNEKVVRPRLSDAEFFFLQDQKQPLASRQQKLANMVFQAQLGTLWDKSERIAKLASEIAKLTDGDEAAAKQAGLLAKCDLTSELVGEFPELQGIAGTYYARLEGQSDEVANAIAEQYLPRFAGDKLPQTRTGVALALADRLDTLVGIFGIGQAPTGNKDPFSLRRAAIGILRLLIENKLSISLSQLIELAAQGYGDKLKDIHKAQADALQFVEGRYRAMYEDQGVSVDVIQAVQVLNPASPLDFDYRIKAVSHFKTLPEAQALAAANKRVANILAKEGNVSGDVDASLLAEQAEKDLYQALQAISPVVTPLLQSHDYTPALTELAALRAPIDAFFDNVMVMADDAAIKQNRLRLLAELRALFISVADVSVLQ
ncbi:glycine--tRNA ligase subunit beta [Alkanindiges hydrocarboniclasticus]|uniref:Glycine--tRNA ligase beta subunit n=1 Tax=Alkanindiges hydrocarboniclasticus TaxID=1907941 RepID=A0A1S8CV45_9GAMM|nr:glycine--tRNA ligase subunit beta [Alkanindiges hydrocarboniclasticus]ONG40870.1 glycine--tRNA ligase subunit beta [Alkanindiges hydrocarboniclasticus]